MYMASFILNSILIGVGLAMDAFSVSLADGLRFPNMKVTGRLRIAGAFAFFQFMMPLIGYFLVTYVKNVFTGLRAYIPWIGFVLLLYLGIKMIAEGIRERREDQNIESIQTISKHQLITQAIATSIDALSVGFVFVSYSVTDAISASVIIGIVTFIICTAGIHIGRHFGIRYAFASTIVGGIILIFIGIRLLL